MVETEAYDLSFFNPFGYRDGCIQLCNGTYDAEYHHRTVVQRHQRAAESRETRGDFHQSGPERDEKTIYGKDCFQDE